MLKLSKSKIRTIGMMIVGIILMRSRLEYVFQINKPE